MRLASQIRLRISLSTFWCLHAAAGQKAFDYRQWSDKHRDDPFIYLCFDISEKGADTFYDLNQDDSIYL
jgi:hypothetical protein